MAPGLAVVVKSERNVRVTLFMSDAARERWRSRAERGRSFKYQQHAPPAHLPPGTVSYYTSGHGEARKKNMPPPPCGFGVVGVTGGVGHDHAGGWQTVTLGGQVAVGVTPRVRTTTENLGHLMAFIQALEWALIDPDTRGRPVVIRYTNAYAANVCTGVWRAKKHKEVATHGRALWERLRRARGGKVWMHHSAGKSRGYIYTITAHALALSGQGGTVECRRHDARDEHCPRGQKRRRASDSAVEGDGTAVPLSLTHGPGGGGPTHFGGTLLAWGG